MGAFGLEKSLSAVLSTLVLGDDGLAADTHAMLGNESRYLIHSSLWIRFLGKEPRLELLKLKPFLYTLSEHLTNSVLDSLKNSLTVRKTQWQKLP